MGVLLAMLLLTVIPITVYANSETAEAATDEEESWLNRIKNGGANIINSVKDTAAAATDKGGKILSGAKESASKTWRKTKKKAKKTWKKASDSFKEWNKRQEDEFWEQTRQQMGIAEASTRDANLSVEDSVTDEEEIPDKETADKKSESTVDDKSGKFDIWDVIITLVAVIGVALLVYAAYSKWVSWYNDPDR